jgi:pimeloyl-ACP methyl ester carboxylesterase
MADSASPSAPSGPPAALVTAGDVRLACEERGAGDAVLLVAGGAMDMDQWDAQVAALAPRRRVIRFDQRGVGASDGPPGGYTIEQMADDTIALIDALRAEPCVLFGNSLGGSIAIAAALRAPAVVRALIVAATSAGPAGPPMPPETQTEMFRASALPVVEAAAAAQEIVFAGDYPRRHPEVLERAIAKREASTAPLIATLGPLQSVAAYDPLPGLKSLRLPTLILHGARDRMVPAGNATLLAEHIAGAELRLLPDAGHGLVMESAGPVNAAVLAFLDSL